MAIPKIKPAPCTGAGHNGNERPKPNATRAEGNIPAGESQPRPRSPREGFKHVAARYLTYCKIYNETRTITNKFCYVRRLVAFFGDVPAAAITQTHVLDYIAARKDAGAGNPTVNRELSTFKHFFGYAITTGAAVKNPVPGVRFLPERRKPLNIPPVAAVKTFLNWCRAINSDTGEPNDALLFDLVAIAVNTGLRRGDILTIRGDDIDVGRRTLAVAVSKTREVQYLPLNEMALGVLARRKCRGYIFPNGDTHLLDFRRRFKTARRAAHFDYRFKELRHFFATTILTNGNDIRTTQGLMGHANIQTTERYLAVLGELPRRAVDSLDLN